MRAMTKAVALLLILLSVISVSRVSAQSILDPSDPVITYNSSNPPTEPTFGQIGKWVRTVRLGWNTTNYKCYIYKGVAFRLRFPKTYNPTANDGKKYPMMVFWHGLGERGPITDNEYQLYHGARYFDQSVSGGTFDGYVIFFQSQGFWGGGHYDYMKEIIDYMVQNNKLDPFQISQNGLSAGGQACWEMAKKYPQYVGASIPMSWTSYFYGDPEWVNALGWHPIWNVQGGLDGSPAPPTSESVRDAYLRFGSNYRYTLYPDLAHGTWDRTWTEPDFWPYQKRAYASNPWPLRGRTEFCPGDPIRDTMGLTPGFDEYQWRKDGVLIPGATTNTYIALQTGTYDARVRRGTEWSEWSRVPVVVKIKGATVAPPITVSGLASRVLPALDGATSVKFEVPEGYATYKWTRVGDPATLSTTRFLTTSVVGSYQVQVTEQFGCVSGASAPVAVVNAAGPNKPDAAVNLIATALSKTAIRLDWTDNPSPQFNETNFEIYRSAQPGGPYAFVGIVGADVRTFTNNGLNPNTQYWYRVRAVNNTGAAAASNEANGTTQFDSQAPTAPTGLTITSTTRNSISISWNASTDDVGVVGYDIYVNGVKSYSTTNLLFLVSNLQTPNMYTITVRARDVAGNVSANSNQVSGQPLLRGLDYKYYTFASTPDKLPDYSTLQPVATNTVPNVTLVPRTQEINFGFLWEGYVNVPVSGSYTFRTNSDDGSRLYLGARNGQGSPYDYAAVPTVDNDGGHGLQDRNSVVLNLTAGTYPIAIAYYNGVGGYGCTVSWRTPQTNNAFTLIPDSAFADKPVLLGTAPAKPTALSATPASYRQVNLSFTDNSTNESGFEIWRSTSPLSNFSPVGMVAGSNNTGTRNYQDTLVNPNTRYYYRVRAVNQFGESAFDRDGQGIEYKYYENMTSYSQLPTPAQFGAMTPVKTGRVANFGITARNRDNNIQFWHTATVNIPVSGIYTFYTTSDDGSRLYVNGTGNANLVVNNDGLHGMVEASGSRMLSAGQHTIHVFYFEVTGGEGLEVRVSASGMPKQLIPDSWLGTPLVTATTPAPPAVPLVPGNLVANPQSKSRVQISWTDNATTETKYELYRSQGNNSNYLLYATLPANATSYQDTGLFANATFYYRVRAIGVSNNSGYSNEDSAKTWNTLPVITAMPATRTARTGVVTNLTINATDADGDVLSFTGQNLPAFASVTNNGNGTATLTLTNPGAGTYNNLRIDVADPHGGTAFTQFNLLVNNNYDPTINAVNSVTMNENDEVNIALTAADQNGSDVLTFSVSNAPAGTTLTPGASGTATLMLKPTYGASGVYQVNVQVADGQGGYANRIFTVTVNDKDPNQRVYVRVRHDAYNTIGAPWNTVTSATTSNLVDDKGTATGINLNFSGNYFSGNSGPVTNNNSGVYPDAVIRDYYVFGVDWMGNNSSNATLSGLNPARKYNITLFGASNWNLTPDNGNTNYTINGVTQPLYVQNNTTNTVTFNNISPTAGGVITIAMTKGNGASAGYLNALVINSLFDDGSAPLAPLALAAQNLTGQGVQLTWQNVAYNETGYEIHRATNPAGPFTQIGVANGPDASSYVDNTVSGMTTYYYKVRALSVGGMYSAFSDVASVTTINRLPVINPISTQWVKNNQTLNLPVTATDDPTDVITLTASNLPQFVSFTDNGNRTGTIAINPLASSTGLYKNITITARDNSGASSTTSFDLNVLDNNMHQIYVNFTENSNLAGRPWNNFNFWPSAGTSMTGLKDDRDSTWTGVTLSLPDGFNGIGAVGARPGNGREIYPVTVMRTTMYEQSTTTKRIQISGLDNTRLYNFVFFASHEDGAAAVTNYTINGTTVTLDAAYNYDKVVSINGVTPTSGVITINVTKATGSDFAYLNSLIIQSYKLANVPFAAPTDLRVVDGSRGSITLQWQDRSNNETGFEIFRAASGGSYASIGTVAANVTRYVDNSASLQANTPYFYIVRAIKASAPTTSNYTNVAMGYTYAYAVYVNATNALLAGQPWNNLGAVPQQGYVWENFRDENNGLTSIGMENTGQWAGIYGAGVNTGNNSGIFPDNVLGENYGLFPGQIGSVKLTGLNITMKYDISFFGSAQHTGDVNTAYIVNGKTVMLNTALNKSGLVTMFGITPDQNGEIFITVAPGTPTSQYGLLGALIVKGYNAVSTVTPAPASRSYSPEVVRNDVQVKPIEDQVSVTAFPNPFNQYFQLTISSNEPERLDVQVFDLSGRVVYQNRFGNINSGTTVVRIQPGRPLVPGVYVVKAILGNRKEERVIKITKQ